MTPEQLSEMTAFAAVVEAQGFAAAAGRLGLSKASVSRLVQRLEDRLGARLLNRTTRRLSLTEAGQSFYEGCQRMLAEAEAAEAAVTALSAQPRGTLRLSAPLSFAVRHLGPHLADFLAACPELKLDVVLGDRLVDLVEEGFDVALRIGRLGDSGLVARRLSWTRRVVCAAPAYLRARGLPLQPADLKRHDCLHYSYASSGRSWSFRHADGRRDSVTIAGRVEMTNGDLLASLAEAGQGIAALPTFLVAEALREGRLVRLLPDWEEELLPGIHLVYPARRNLAPKVRAFIDFLAARIGDPPPWECDLPPAVASLEALPQGGPAVRIATPPCL